MTTPDLIPLIGARRVKASDHASDLPMEDYRTGPASLEEALAGASLITVETLGGGTVIMPFGLGAKIRLLDASGAILGETEL